MTKRLLTIIEPHPEGGGFVAGSRACVRRKGGLLSTNHT